VVIVCGDGFNVFGHVNGVLSVRSCRNFSKVLYAGFFDGMLFNDSKDFAHTQIQWPFRALLTFLLKVNQKLFISNIYEQL